MSRLSRLLQPWPGIVFALIGINMVVVGVTVWAATRDPSFAVDPGYDTKAANWQSAEDQHAANRRLGWNIAVVDPTRGASLRFQLRDRDDLPISGGRIDVVAFHHALASRRLQASLLEVAPGVYTADLVLDRPGRWHVSFDAVHGHDRYADAFDFTAADHD